MTLHPFRKMNLRCSTDGVAKSPCGEMRRLCEQRWEPGLRCGPQFGNVFVGQGESQRLLPTILRPRRFCANISYVQATRQKRSHTRTFDDGRDRLLVCEERGRLRAVFCGLCQTRRSNTKCIVYLRGRIVEPAGALALLTRDVGIGARATGGAAA